MKPVDLHVHSTASDGTLSPARLVRLAAESGLSAFALTDHDTVAGVQEALCAARDTELTVIPGIELSCPYQDRELHILGLFLDWQDPALNGALAALCQARRARNERILSLFQQDGFPLTWEDVAGTEHGFVITRAHFARALLKRGCVSSMNEAFVRYLDPGKKYFLPKEALDPEQAIRLIRSAGGFPALAHPLQYRLGWTGLNALLSYLKERGLAGLEVYYSSHTAGDTIRLRESARRFGLLETGGSDFHGANKPDIRLGTGRGSLRVPPHLPDAIRAYLSSAVSPTGKCSLPDSPPKASLP